MKREISRTTAFVRSTKKYLDQHPDRAESLKRTVAMLSDDAFDRRLATHKLKGDRANSWSCSGGYDLRIIFEFVQEKGTEKILLLSLGTHDVVY